MKEHEDVFVTVVEMLQAQVRCVLCGCISSHLGLNQDDRWGHRCRSRQMFGGAKDCCPNIPKLTQKAFVGLLPTTFLPQRSWRSFLCMASKKRSSCVFLETLGAIFAQIFRDFARMFENQNFWECAGTPCTPSYTTGGESEQARNHGLATGQLPPHQNFLGTTARYNHFALPKISAGCGAGSEQRQIKKLTALLCSKAPVLWRRQDKAHAELRLPC